jgi:hypothetical protein
MLPSSARHSYCPIINEPHQDDMQRASSPPTCCDRCDARAERVYQYYIAEPMREHPGQLGRITCDAVCLAPWAITFRLGLLSEGVTLLSMFCGKVPFYVHFANIGGSHCLGITCTLCLICRHWRRQNEITAQARAAFHQTLLHAADKITNDRILLLAPYTPKPCIQLILDYIGQNALCPSDVKNNIRYTQLPRQLL